jgi:nucleoid-associated protein YgaU
MKLTAILLASFFTAALLLSPPVFAKGKVPPEDDTFEAPEPNPPEDEESDESEMPEPEPQPEDGAQAPVKQPEPKPSAKKPAHKEVEEPPQEEEPQPEDGAEVPQSLYSPQSSVQETNSQIPEGANVHTVWVWQESKDCLWLLAKKYYGDPWQWKKIYLENRSTILNPNVIFPKQKIVLPSAQAAQEP